MSKLINIIAETLIEGERAKYSNPYECAHAITRALHEARYHLIGLPKLVETDVPEFPFGTKIELSGAFDDQVIKGVLIWSREAQYNHLEVTEAWIKERLRREYLDALGKHLFPED